MDFRDLEYFSVVAEHRHVGRAAESLGLTQPALSLSLRRLERSMQTKVVTRTPKGVELTAAGSTLLARVKPLLLARQDVVREITDLSAGRSGHLQVGVVAGIAEDLAGAASATLLGEAPTATVKIMIMLVEALPDALRNGDVDLYIASIRAGASADTTREALFDYDYVLYAAAGHPLAGRKKVSLSDLIGARWAVSTATNRWHRLSTMFEESNLPSPRFTLDSNSTTARLCAIASSDLLGIGSRGFVTQSMRRFRLAILPVKEVFTTQRMAVCYRNYAYVAPVARRFIEILKTAAKEIAERP